MLKINCVQLNLNIGNAFLIVIANIAISCCCCRVEEVGYVRPTDVQKQALPLLFSGRDCILHAQVNLNLAHWNSL